MNKINKKEAQKKIDEFFSNKRLSSESVKKIKRLAMKHNIKLGKLREKFCKKCYVGLRSGKIRVAKMHKILVCKECGFANKVRIKNE